MGKAAYVERKALRYLYGDLKEENILLFNLERWAKDNESYNKDLAAFKKLFNSGDRDLQMAAWNALICRKGDFVKEDFTDDELAFLTRCCNAASNRRSCAWGNPGKAFSTGRLIIRPAVKAEELQAYHRHLRRDGDFSLYTGFHFSQRILNRLTLSRPYCFAIYEKKSEKMVGVVGLHNYQEKKRMAEAEWYIFKPYRQKGYGREAASELASQAFCGKLAELRETSWDYMYKKHYAKIDLIRAYIRETNAASQALAEACGFEYRYTDRRYFVIEGKGCEDARVYELTPEML